MASEQQRSIAMVYAEALFELAEEQALSAEIRQELAELLTLLDTNTDFRAFLDTPAIKRDEKAAFIHKVFEDQVSPLFLDFLQILARKGRFSLLRDIHRCYIKLEDEKAGRVKGVLTTAVELSEQDQSRLREQIGRALRKTVQIEHHVAPEILGGLVLQVEDTVMDLSVRGSLEQLHEALLHQGAAKLASGGSAILDT